MRPETFQAFRMPADISVNINNRDTLLLEVIVNINIIPDDLWVGLQQIQLRNKTVSMRTEVCEWRKERTCRRHCLEFSIRAESGVAHNYLGKIDRRVVRRENSLRYVRLCGRLSTCSPLYSEQHAHYISTSIAFSGKVERSSSEAREYLDEILQETNLSTMRERTDICGELPTKSAPTCSSS